MAATDRFNTASFGVLPNENPANAILFDEKSTFAQVHSGNDEKPSDSSPRLRILFDSLPAIRFLGLCRRSDLCWKSLLSGRLNSSTLVSISTYEKVMPEVSLTPPFPKRYLGSSRER